jgi:uncharacterized protein with NRDE domain
MCLILFVYRVHPDYPLVLLANRDEFYARATTPLSFWADAPDILAGRDQVGGGTWMGIARSGRFAALTNYRDPTQPTAGPSRGVLVADFLRGTESGIQYLEHLASSASSYAGFNLIVGDARGFYYYSNRGPDPVPILPGVHGLSNALLDTPWPKVRRGKDALKTALASMETPDASALMRILQEREIAPDSELPDTGVGEELERVLSPVFITSPRYGTRSSTVLTVAASGVVGFHEHSHDDGQTRRFTLEMPPSLTEANSIR